MRTKKAMLSAAALLVLTLGMKAWAQDNKSDRRAAQFAASYEQEANGDLVAAISSVQATGTDDYLSNLRLGWLHYRSELWNKSVGHYKKAAQAAPEAVEPLLAQMMPLQAAGRFDEAIQAGQSVLNLDPGNYTALSRMAWIYYTQKKYQKATTLYRRLVRRYPTDVEMLLGLGYSLSFEGKKKDAAAYFRRVLLLSPGNPRALEGLK